MRRMLRDIDRSADVLVKIGAADAAPGDLNLKLSRRRLGGLATSSTRTSCLPYQTAAFISNSILRYESYAVRGVRVCENAR